MTKRGHHPTGPLNDERLVHIAGQGLPPIPGLDRYRFRDDGGMSGTRDLTISSRDLAGLTPAELKRALERGYHVPEIFSTPHQIGGLAVENL